MVSPMLLMECVLVSLVELAAVGSANNGTSPFIFNFFLLQGFAFKNQRFGAGNSVACNV